MKILYYLVISVFILISYSCTEIDLTSINSYPDSDSSHKSFQNEDRIKPYTANPKYWQYKGEPILLIGASDEDNLFNHPEIDLESHLDLLVAHGGNYIRNTMSSRNLKNGNIWPHEVNAEGKYDLNTWNQDYWDRLTKLLELSNSRGIIVQIELWDRFDFTDYYGDEPWSNSPWNPANNINYTASETGILDELTTHPGKHENYFFKTTPGYKNIPAVLAYQEAFVEKLLSISLEFPNVLYVMNNETSEKPEWSDHWASFVNEYADEKDLDVYISEMWDRSLPASNPESKYFYPLNRPELYSFLEFSQNNHLHGQEHWDQLMIFNSTSRMSGSIPINNVKIYGSSTYGNGEDAAINNFWRNIFAGNASSRFHRPTAGLELNGIGGVQLISMEMFLHDFNIFTSQPSNDLLSGRSGNEAYCTADIGEQYAVFFTDGGSVDLDLASGNYSIKWLNVDENYWTSASITDGGNEISLSTPGSGRWVALIIRN